MISVVHSLLPSHSPRTATAFAYQHSAVLSSGSCLILSIPLVFDLITTSLPHNLPLRDRLALVLRIETSRVNVEANEFRAQNWIIGESQKHLEDRRSVCFPIGQSSPKIVSHPRCQTVCSCNFNTLQHCAARVTTLRQAPDHSG